MVSEMLELGRIFNFVIIQGENPNQMEREDIIDEALVMTNFHHDNVLNLIGVSFEINGSPIVIMPYMPNGSLLNHLRINKQNIKLIDQLNFAFDIAKGNFENLY